MAAENKFTQGKWIADLTVCNVVVKNGAGSFLVADCCTDGAPDDDAEQVANTKLISAAPALLAALQSLIAPEANKQVQALKDALFAAAPDIEALAHSAVKKAAQ